MEHPLPAGPVPRPFPATLDSFTEAVPARAASPRTRILRTLRADVPRPPAKVRPLRGRAPAAKPEHPSARPAPHPRRRRRLSIPRTPNNSRPPPCPVLLRRLPAAAPLLILLILIRILLRLVRIRPHHLRLRFRRIPLPPAHPRTTGTRTTPCARRALPIPRAALPHARRPLPPPRTHPPQPHPRRRPPASLRRVLPLGRRIRERVRRPRICAQSAKRLRHCIDAPSPHTSFLYPHRSARYRRPLPHTICIQPAHNTPGTAHTHI
ncbi:hypothetical protein C8J57DRAFT_1275600 [Mycena rebaudengoi]|nr:hypothetical protein C8J57DRAFT_1275600 [Mycena rebaudengoi]